MAEFDNHPEMLALLERQKAKREALIDYLSSPTPRFVAKTVQGFWVCWDRSSDSIAQMCDSEKEAVNLSYIYNEDSF